MLSTDQNIKITRVGHETPAGTLLRQYWQPAALVEELAGERPAKPVRLLGEELVVFRDDKGEYGLIGRHCPHRGADLAYARLVDGGLRCPFHGWLLDRNGACLEQPAEPLDSNFHQKIRHAAYPCRVANGIIFAWMGQGEAPPLPSIDAITAPDSHCFAFKGLIEANWLQATEVGIDPAHASFLHRFFEDDDPDDGYGQQFRDNTDGADIPVTQLLRNHFRPEISVENVDYGMRIFARRDLGDAGQHIRVTNLLFPNAIVIPMSTEMTITQWHVPIDEENSYWYAIFCSYGAPVDHAKMREQRLALFELPEYRAKRNRDNNYGYDPQEQRTATFTGMGMDINVHDNWAVESPGPLQDRTVEHLGTTDRAIIANRKTLLDRIDHVEKGPLPEPLSSFAEQPIAVDTVCPDGDWAKGWRLAAAARGNACSWVTEEKR